MTRAALAFLLFASPALSQHAGGAHDPDTPYAGFEAREVTSLSAADLEELRRGGGWGLALPAELNGRPGPAHLLELKDRIPLEADQVERIQRIFHQMQAEAIDAGARFIAAEAALDAGFQTPTLDRAALEALLAEAEAARAALRLVHLSRHLMTTEILTERQIQRYAVLRGYAGDPCASVPEGHNAQMWRKHNGCE